MVHDIINGLMDEYHPICYTNCLFARWPKTFPLKEMVKSRSGVS